MKYLKNTVFAGIITLIIFPSATLGSTSGGGSFGGGMPLINIGNQVIDFLQGPIAMILITLGLILGGVGIVFGRENDKRGFKRLGWAVVGGSIIVGASSLVTFFFGGAVI